jgi:hypothetical protein
MRLPFNSTNFIAIQEENEELHLLINKLTAQLLIARAENDSRASNPSGTDARGEDGAGKAPRGKGRA